MLALVLVLLTTLGPAIFDALLFANGRPLRVDGMADAGRVTGGGVDTACGILDRSGVRFKFNLDPVLFLLLELPLAKSAFLFTE